MSQADDISALVKSQLQQAQNAADYAALIESSIEAANECYVQAENFVRQVRE